MSIPPLIGSFNVPSFADLAERLNRAATLFMDGRPFSGYISTHTQGNFYGLSTDDAQKLIVQHGEEVKTINLSANAANGKSINVSIRFGEAGSPSRGQFVIAVADRFEQEDIRAMLNGVYHDPTEEEIAFRNSTRAAQEPPASETIRPLVSTPKNAPKSEARQGATRDSFSFSKDLEFDQLQSALDQIRKDFFPGSRPSYKIINRSGDSTVNPDEDTLREALDDNRDRILRLLVEIPTRQGDLLDLTLNFNTEHSGPNAEVLIVSDQARQVLAALRKLLQVRRTDEQEVIRQSFRFLPSQVTIDPLINLMGAVSLKYFNRTPFRGALGGLQGQSIRDLEAGQLRTRFLQGRSEIARVELSVGNKFGSSMRLEFFLQGKDQGLGTLECQGLPAQAPKVVLEALGKSMRIGPVSAALAAQPMTVNPVFEGRGFREQNGQCLVALPLEAYWANVVAERIEVALLGLGLKGEGIPPLFEEGQAENIWSAVNEASMVILDLTYKHTDVLFIAGMAQTLGKKIVLLSQHDRDIPPDWKRFPWMVYESHESGLDKLEVELQEALRQIRG